MATNADLNPRSVDASLTLLQNDWQKNEPKIDSQFAKITNYGKNIFMGLTAVSAVGAGALLLKGAFMLGAGSAFLFIIPILLAVALAVVTKDFYTTQTAFEKIQSLFQQIKFAGVPLSAEQKTKLDNQLDDIKKTMKGLLILPNVLTINLP